MSARWDRLAATLADHGVAVTVDARPYSEAIYGRVRHGTSYGVTIRRRETGERVCIRDRWWRKNPDVWIGWEVYAENAEGFLTRAWPLTKKRSEVVANVRAALEVMPSRAGRDDCQHHRTGRRADGARRCLDCGALIAPFNPEAGQ